jgi:hypothetical protein
MPKYLFAYHGGRRPDTPAEGEKVMAAWGTWFGTLGTAVADPGAPVGQSHTVAKSGLTANGGANPVSGYSLVTAAGYDQAVEMARGCPILANGGTVEVAEIVAM